MEIQGSVQVRRDRQVVWVTLDHDRKYNAMSRAMWRSLKTVFEEIQQDAQVRCVVVRGARGHFCAGGDIAEYPSFRFDAAELETFHEEEVWGGLQAMLDCDVPIVAQIEGFCMGAGVEIASCCDIRIASSAARFGAPIARLGFPMAPKEAALVAQAVGASTARAMLLAAEIFDADYMQRRNFLMQIFSEEEIATQALQLTIRMAALAPQAARLNKQTFRALNRPPALMDTAQAAIESGANPYAYANSAEHREGVMAFTEKRKPQF
ncbi:enoyl-CoA hydratase/isomerase family protein [Rhodoferax saidenbachensis]|uniref:enoyl-CoA hydratase/isomerase family protein n=1 Tax=Rhodoferax saidenbachensis TaxID=1484693 RepID=UPI0004BBD321|nr:enoyl-CoA hydratase/isomerase family protein [Rhodoferax saidenbachensis]